MNTQLNHFSEITCEQLNRNLGYKLKWLSIAQESEAASSEELRHAIYYLYQKLSLDLPKIHTFVSPKTLRYAIERKRPYKKNY
jgi:hypothetical protein